MAVEARSIVGTHRTACGPIFRMIVGIAMRLGLGNAEDSISREERDSRRLAAARGSSWSEETLEELAEQEPMTLLSLIAGGVLSPPELSLAAELAGNLEGSSGVVAVLLGLLEHESALVREGAIYGLSRHLSEEVAERLRELAEVDPSTGVREAAGETLDG